MRKLHMVLSLVVMAAGCGGDDDVIQPVDAPSIDAPVACEISSASFGALGTLTADEAFWDGGNGGGLGEIFVPLNTANPPDRLVLDMWGRTTHHMDPFVAGSYEVTGVQLNLASCWMCLTIAAGWAQGAPPPLDQIYMATGGVVDITTLDANPGGMYAVTVTNATFEHVNVNPPNPTTPVGDGCVTRIDSVTFMGNFAGGAVRPPGQSGSLPAGIAGRYSRQ